ncbi:ubiquinol-cytochrome-c reductase complex assembly factor 1 [Helicoverpa zea]|uniref:ubiquinol-cytochrome-c reductase complex assembly factor 1 n=1 Tax=Helicoverpa zea TaxID=7113 RepID=UPI001F57623F|nr:ubiquinol-cytochrome-c reductase complex assembly factor 1 [Helicoverpa zea]
MFRSRAISRLLWQQRGCININYARPCVSGLCITKANTRNLNTVAVEDSYVKKFMNAIGWMDQSRTRLKLTGYFLYEGIPENVSYADWFESLELPDTFVSWFTITELHVWLLMVRYMAEDVVLPTGDKKKYIKGDGHFIRNCIIEALWADVANKIKLLEGANPAIARKQVSELSEQFQAALVAYDEGLSDDKVLAAAIWRRFYSLSEDVKAEHIERLVKFIRHQISQLDKIPSEDLKSKPNITWLSILDH